MRRMVFVALIVLLGASACRDGKVGPGVGVTAPAPDDATHANLVATATAAPAQTTFLPPRHLVFAPGETIASKDFGIFFLDPATGAAEGWVTPKGAACGLVTTGAEGRRLFYSCRQPQPSTPASATRTPESAVTYVLDTVSGDWSPFVLPPGSYGIIAPDGGTLTQAAISAIRVVVERTPTAAPRVQSWAPDSSALVVDFATPDDNHPVSLLYLIRMDSAEPVWLTDRSDQAEWSPDSSKFVLTERMRGQRLQSIDAIAVLDAKGRKLWSRDAFVRETNARWSPDSRHLGVEVLHSQPSKEEPNPAYDLLVLDGSSGEPLFRVLAAFACTGQYWTADGRLVVGPYGPGNPVRILVDPVARTLRGLDSYLTPSPMDPDLGIFHDLNDFYAVSLKDSSKRLIAHTTVGPAWDFEHEPLFAGRRLMFRSHHGGHGGCGEGDPPRQLPRTELQFPPFVDP